MQKLAFVIALAMSLLAIHGQGTTANAPQPSLNPANVTVIHKNEAFPVLGAITVSPCAAEDCSDVEQTGS